MIGKWLKKEPPEQAFWKWFSENEGRFRIELETNRDKFFNTLSKQLSKVDKDLVFEFGEMNDKVIDFVISADGLYENIPVVESLVGQAPTIPGWKITAFRPRMGDGMSIRYGKYEISADTLTFTSKEVPGESMLDIHVFVEHYEEEMNGALFIILDFLIGEYDVMTRIGEIEFGPQQTGVGEPLNKLPVLVDKLKKSAHH